MGARGDQQSGRVFEHLAHEFLPSGAAQPNAPAVHEGLGWAFNEERACDEAHLQEFQHGLMTECTQFVMPKQKTRVFILFDDGTYDIYIRECLEAPCRANRLQKVDSAFRAPPVGAVAHPLRC